MEDPIALRRRSRPDATALIDAATDDAWTYAALDDAVEQTAGRLASLGVGPGDRLGAVLPTRPAFVRLLFAAWRLGATLVPFNVRDSPAEIGDAAAVADPVAVVCGASTAGRAAAAVDRPLVTVDSGQADDAEPLADVAPAPVESADPPLTADRLILFTSGTTGEPTAVRLTGRNLVASAGASAVRLGVLPGDRWLDPLPMYHAGGVSVALRSALYGTTAVLTRGFDPADALGALRAYDCTGVSLVPTMLDDLLDAGTLPDSLRFVLVGGAACPPELIERCADRDVPLCPSYGMTETASQIATARPEEARTVPESVGRPLVATDVTVVDEEGTPQPTGEAGDVVVSGPTVTPGYLGTADVPRSEYGFHTGDRGVITDAGRLRILGRRDDRIVTGGENVSPAAVESALREHPSVAEVAVVGLSDPKWGERVAALVVPSDEEVSVAALESFARDRLAGYEVPRDWGVADALPRTASGTVDRNAVRERLTDGQV